MAPAELEDLLKSHPKVADAAVIGVPDERAGEVPVAYVIPKPGKEKVQSDDVKKYIAEKVAHYKQLSSVVFTDTIPKSASGKILRRMLKETHLKGSKWVKFKRTVQNNYFLYSLSLSLSLMKQLLSCFVLLIEKELAVPDDSLLSTSKQCYLSFVLKQMISNCEDKIIFQAENLNAYI